MLENVKKFFELDRETAEKQKTIMILTAVTGVLGTAVVAVLDASGIIKDADVPEVSKPE
ncbi:hypothetical protein KAR91_10140 [Candidatus Pacearchaeota archaeon]|nr:hypothetical protein [Candidatus Pacearchaeota archaeon]